MFVLADRNIKSICNRLDNEVLIGMKYNRTYIQIYRFSSYIQHICCIHYYTTQSFFFYFYLSLFLFQSNITNAVVAYETSHNVSVQREIKLLCLHEIGWCRLIQLDFGKAMEHFGDLK